MGPLKKIGIVLACALAYHFLYLLNGLLFSPLVYSKGINWIFLPSGMRLILVLVFGCWGALGIAMASIAGGYLGNQFDGDVVTYAVAGMISGLAPWLAKQISLERWHLADDLSDLDPAILLRLALVFSTTSALLHQLWYVWRGVADNFVNGVLVMEVGDFVGALIVLYAAKMFIGVVLRHNPQ